MLVFWVLLIACTPAFTDQSQSLRFSLIEYKSNLIYEEKGGYGSPAWLSDEYIAIIYDPPYFEGYPQDSRIHLYNVTNDKWSEIGPSLIDAFSFKYGILYMGMLSRLPNGNLGISYHSYGDGSGTGYDETQGIVEYDIDTGIAKIINQFDKDVIGVAVEFSYSPDMNELIQGDFTNRLIGTKLYYIGTNNITQIVPDFIRADGPAWSPHKREIAFWGTEKLPGNMLPTQIADDFDLINVVHTPWDLYLSAPDGSNLRKIVSSVREHRSATWSPTRENIIAFSGIYNGVPGVWLLDLNTMNITRIYDDSVNGLDWSPDGSKIVIVKETNAIENFPKHEYLIGIINVSQ